MISVEGSLRGRLVGGPGAEHLPDAGGFSEICKQILKKIEKMQFLDEKYKLLKN